ncbi:gp53-like domain-containing protein [Citrobacter amalonaticus]
MGDAVHLSDWSKSLSSDQLATGWRRCPDGFIEQFIVVNVNSNGSNPSNVTVNFPIPFPNQVVAIRQAICLTSDPSARFSGIRSGTITNSSAGMSFVTATNNNFYLSVIGR